MKQKLAEIRKNKFGDTTEYQEIYIKRTILASANLKSTPEDARKLHLLSSIESEIDNTIAYLPEKIKAKIAAKAMESFQEVPTVWQYWQVEEAVKKSAECVFAELAVVL